MFNCISKQFYFQLHYSLLMEFQDFLRIFAFFNLKGISTVWLDFTVWFILFWIPMALYPNERKVTNCLLSWIHCKLNLLHAVLKRILEGKNESPKLERKNVNSKICILRFKFWIYHCKWHVLNIGLPFYNWLMLNKELHFQMCKPYPYFLF